MQHDKLQESVQTMLFLEIQGPCDIIAIKVSMKSLHRYLNGSMDVHPLTDPLWMFSRINTLKLSASDRYRYQYDQPIFALIPLIYPLASCTEGMHMFDFRLNTLIKK